MRPHIALTGILSLLLAIAVGCSPPEEPKAQTDDAKKRAVAEGISNAEAAAHYSYGEARSTYDHNRPAGRYGQGTNGANQTSSTGVAANLHVPDFFKGMDSLCAIEAPDALLDKQGVDAEGLPRRSNRSVKAPALETSERIGRNTWMVWCAGNEGFWDWLCTDSLGFIDLLKLVDSRNRNQRFETAGLINEPGMEQAKRPNSDEFGLWLDLPADDEVREWRQAFVNETFEKIAAGRHKSQVGLQRKTASGDYNGSALYVGDPEAFKDEDYRYPSSYLALTPGDSDHPGSDYSDDDDQRADEAAAAAYSQRYSKLDETVPPPDLYGLSSGVIGLRLFPNPYFDAAAQERWDAERFRSDPSYYNDPNLVRPYRVGMSCAFCHTSFHPLKSPRDATNPRWENLSGNIGAQYLSMRATVGGQLKPEHFVYHLLDSQPRGTIDTSLIASDNINNPNTMNAVFGLRQRALLSLSNPPENLSSRSNHLPSLWKTPDPGRTGGTEDVAPDAIVALAEKLGILNRLRRSNDDSRRVPRILLDGSDSIGTWGALARVYLNIGSYWEQWNRLHQVVIGFTPQRPFRLSDCEESSVYWNATERRVPGLRDYFLRVTPTMPLLATEDAEDRLKPIGPAELDALRSQSEKQQIEFDVLLAAEKARRVDAKQLERGRRAFARNCIVCHSSIQPESTLAWIPDFDSAAEASDQGDAVQDASASADDSYAEDDDGETPDGQASPTQRLAERRLRSRTQSAKNGEFWEHDPAQWLNDPEYLRWALRIVENPTFWTENYLSTDYRIPVNLVKTNAARAIATNGMTGHMWEDFASESYRALPTPGTVEFFNPYLGKDGAMDRFTPRHVNPNTGRPDGGGGPGYYRIPTLMSIWATAPFLHNNSLGLYNNDPSVDGRLEAFDDAIRKLLWPERRLASSSYNGATAERLRRDHGLIWRTTQESYLTIDSERVPYLLHRFYYASNLYKVRGFHWLHGVQPMWLPSSILIVGAFVVLLTSNLHGRRRLFAYLFLAAAAVTAAVLGFVQNDPQLRNVGWLRQIQPWLLPVLALLAVGIALWLPLSRRFVRYAGYALLLVGLVGGLAIYFNAGRLGDVRIGPIPAGTPVNLLANFNPEAEPSQQKAAVSALVNGLAEIKSRHLEPPEARRLMKEKIAPALMDVNKCPDFVMDKGHDFPWFDSMSDEDKNGLIELLKTL